MKNSSSSDTNRKNNFDLLTNGEFSFSIVPLQTNESNIAIEYAHPQRQKLHHLFWMEKGKGSFLLDYHFTKLQDHTAYYTAPNQILALRPTCPMQGFLIRFTSDFPKLAPHRAITLHCKQLAGGPGITLDHKNASDMTRLAQAMLKQFQTDAILQQDILREYLRIMLVYLIKANLSVQFLSNTYQKPDTVNQFFQLLQENYSTRKQVTAYARELALSANYLNTIIKKACGLSARQLIHQQIMDEAKRQAIYTTRTMREIAYDLGFDEYAHFSKFFKKLEGRNFTDYRVVLKAKMQSLPLGDS